MGNQILINPEFFKKRWVAYIDLLGSSDMVLNDPWCDVFIRYSKAIESFTDLNGSEGNIGNDWFSDSFIFYSEDDSKGSFQDIHHCTHWFIINLLRAGIPACGAIAYDDFYADKDNRLYFGKALVDAHALAENIDFITHILTRSAEEQVVAIGLPVENWHYAYIKVPYKENKDNKEDWPEKLPAYIVGSAGSINGRRVGLDELRELMHSAKSPSVKQKYKNTIDFAEKHLKSRQMIPPH
jgi:hypothetical protein